MCAALRSLEVEQNSINKMIIIFLVTPNGKNEPLMSVVSMSMKLFTSVQ